MATTQFRQTQNARLIKLGNNLFGANISGLVAQALGPLILPAVLTKVYQGERIPGQLSSGVNPIEETHDCRAIRYSHNTVVKDSGHFKTQIPKNRQLVLILGDTIAGGTVRPELGDKLSIESENLTIDDVNFDPDRAAYICQVS